MEYNFNQIWEKCLGFNIEQKPEEFKKLMDFLNDTKNKRYALEIGSNYGGTTFGLCHLYENVLTIDIKHDPNFDRIKEIFPTYNYIISDSRSNNTVNYIKNLGIKFDFIFIDGDHSYEGVKNDYEKYKQFLSEEGFMAFHDIVESKETEEYDIFVSKLWNELLPQYKNKHEFIAKVKDDNYSRDNEFHRILKDQDYRVWGGIGLIQNHKVSVFVHNYLDNNWYEIVYSQIQKLINSGLYKRADKIFYGVYSTIESNYEIFYSMIKKIDSDLKIEIVKYDSNDAEFNTLINLQNYCVLNPNGSVLYFHTKGSSRERNHYINSWRECMEYFVIEKWKVCLEDLVNEKGTVCGALYVEWFKFLDYQFDNYFSGNFWWASSKHINTLPSLVKLHLDKPDNRTVAEMWLGMAPHRWISYYSEQINNYYEYYFDPNIYKSL
jgi:predicted O-methyltransferase YrrM